ncbi:MAG: hypothetical protein P8182_13310 [Deltaproteobacteria bacterium]
MTVTNNNVRRPESPAGKRITPGWTSMHSWIFLIIVAVGLTVIVMENRYHYLSPVGLGKAYRIDRLFGSIQEFEPNMGWITAQLQAPPPTRMGQPPAVPSQAVPQAVPGAAPGAVLPPTVGTKMEEPRPAPAGVKEETLPQPTAKKEVPVTVERAPQQAPVEKKPEMSREERLKAFIAAYPDYGKEEFQLANDDLFPDWKKKVAPNGTWQQFLRVYGQFIQWWTEAGSPPEPGFKLWQDFLATKGGR